MVKIVLVDETAGRVYYRSISVTQVNLFYCIGGYLRIFHTRSAFVQFHTSNSVSISCHRTLLLVDDHTLSHLTITVLNVGARSLNFNNLLPMSYRSVKTIRIILNGITMLLSQVRSCLLVV